MPSYKIHSIKNNKKLSFIMEGENEEGVKNILSLEGFIVITIELLQDEDHNKINHFIFNALKDNKNRMEGKVEAPDIFQAYKILKEDYQYTVLKLYPAQLTNPVEQDFIFKNVLEVFAGQSNQRKNINTAEKASTIITAEVALMKKYFETLIPLIIESQLADKEVLLYNIKKIMITNSPSGMEIIMKKATKELYEKATTSTKKAIYKRISPIIKRTGLFVLPPGYFIIMEALQKIAEIFTILFLPNNSVKQQLKQKQPKKENWATGFFKKASPDKQLLLNKNIQLLLQKKYRSSKLDIFDQEGRYAYVYSLMRQFRSLWWIKTIQEYITVTCIYAGFFITTGVVSVGGILGTDFLFFNQILISFLSVIFVSLVFFAKEI